MSMSITLTPPAWLVDMMSLRSKSGLNRQTGWVPIWMTVAMGIGSGEFQASWRRQRRRHASFHELTP